MCCGSEAESQARDRMSSPLDVMNSQWFGYSVPQPGPKVVEGREPEPKVVEPEAKVAVVEEPVAPPEVVAPVVVVEERVVPEPEEISVVDPVGKEEPAPEQGRGGLMAKLVIPVGAAVAVWAVIAKVAA